MPALSLRKLTSLSLDQALLDEARSLGVDLGRAAEIGLREAVLGAKAWLRENAEALESHNAWIEANGLPLERYRQF